MAEVTRTYEQCQSALEAELGAHPSSQTRDLYNALST
jgi:DNA-binding SARP family transcriptional activator